MLDGTKENKDKSSATPDDTSSGLKGTSKDKGKLYTVDAITKIKSDSAAEAGRQRVAAEHERDTLKQALQSTTNRLDALEREANESRLAEVRGDPEQLKAYQREQSNSKLQRELDDLRRELAREKEQLKADREAVDRDRSVVSVAYLAAKHGLETEVLESLGISDPEILERVAEKLAGAKPKTEPGEGGEEGGEELHPDSSEGSGAGVGTLTTESVEKSSMASLAKALEKTS